MQKWVLVCAIALCLFGCGGGDGGTTSGSGFGGGSGGGSGGGAITDTQRTAVFTAVRTKLLSLYATTGLTADQIDTQIAAYMQTRPEFAKVGITDQRTVWGQFTDGRVYVVANNRFPSWYAAPKTAGASSLPLVKPSTVHLPMGLQARLLHSFGKGFLQQTSPISEMGAWLKSAGYTVVPTTEGDARLSTLRNFSGDGFFYFNTHGGSVVFPKQGKTYAALTSTLRDEFADKLPEIKDDLDNERILYFEAANGESTVVNGKTVPVTDCRYAIASGFVAKYWHFAQDAVVFMNTCYSGKNDVVNGSQLFREACFANGAAVYLGWTDILSSPTSEDAPRYFVDRMVGGNKYLAESPDQRPFFAADVVADMHKHGLVPAGKADLLLFTRPGVTSAGLKPAIEYVQVAELADLFYLVGDFGDDKGQVFVGGQEATDVTWTNKLITCHIPRSGAGSSGDVYVKIRDKESNHRQLTLWSSTFSSTEKGEGTLKCVITAKLLFRQDLGKRRDKMGDVVDYTDPIPFFAAQGSTLSYTASGVHTNGAGKVLEKWSGSGSPPLVFHAITGIENGWTFDGALNPADMKVYLALICGAAKTVTTDSQTTKVIAGGGGEMATLDTNAWSIGAFQVKDNPAYTFAQWSSQFAPPTDQQY